MDYFKYSVLMSVYFKERADFLRASMNSICAQTVPANDFVLVCDGLLNDELDKVIQEFQNRLGDILQVVRLSENTGLGNALNVGLRYCKNEIVVRMDSDDISFAERCERQIEVFQNRPEISICSSTVLEFRNSTSEVIGKRCLPEQHKEICVFSRKRNPFNHPAVVFRKSAVEAAGGYKETYHLFEDYYLWIRMLMNGYIGYNIQTPLVYMRAPLDIYMRRGGKEYAKDMLSFHTWMRKSGWSKSSEYITGALPHAVICVLPNWMRKIVYEVLH